MKPLGLFDRIDMEASTVSFKHNSKLFNALASLFGDLKNNAKNADLIDSQFSGIVFDCLGIRTSFSIHKTKEINAAVQIPEVTPNHPLIQWVGKYISNREAVRVARSVKELEGYVDFKQVRVSGVLSEIETTTFVTTGAIEALTSEELTAVMLHELGHAFYHFAFLGLNTACASAMMAVGEEFARANNAPSSESIKIRLIDGFSKNAEIKVQNSRIGNASPEEAVVFIRDSYQQKWRHLHAVDGFDAREVEYLADQFSVRMGAGYHLVSALDKMWIKEGKRERFPIVTKILISVAWIIVFLFAPLGGLAVVFAILSVNSILYNPIYDSEQNRMERIWREMLLGLSKCDLSPAEKKGIIQQIDDIREKSKHYMEEMGFWERFFFMVTKDNRRGSYIVDQQEQERMSRNTLFLSAAKLNSV